MSGRRRTWIHTLGRVWPQSLFGRLVVASAIAVLLAQVGALLLIAHERERFVMQEGVREWSRRIAEITLMLQPLDASERAQTTTRLIEQYSHFGQRGLAGEGRTRLFPEPGPRMGAAPHSGVDPPTPLASLPPPKPRPRVILPLPLGGDFEHPLAQTLQSILGPGYHISVAPASGKRAIPVSPLQALERRATPTRLYDVSVQFPDGDSTLFRLARPAEGAPLPRNLFVNLSMLMAIIAVALFATARTVTRPLRQLARAADRVGRDVRQPKLPEEGSREIRDAARAFNTMQDRLQRYLDSRTRVLAAMSHDLKTPLTRLRLQVETLEDPQAQVRIGKQLDEMEGMVRGALALFRGLDDDEALASVNINTLLTTLHSEFFQMGGSVTIEGGAQREFIAKPQALKRCLTNLIENAIKFGGRAKLRVADGGAVVIRVMDDGPGIAPEELERVFEPFYRVESSRNRDSGGTGLGLSIARDIAQSHGGSLVLQNLPRGLEAVLTLPRRG